MCRSNVKYKKRNIPFTPSECPPDQIRAGRSPLNPASMGGFKRGSVGQVLTFHNNIQTKFAWLSTSALCFLLLHPYRISWHPVSEHCYRPVIPPGFFNAFILKHANVVSDMKHILSPRLNVRLTRCGQGVQPDGLYSPTFHGGTQI